WIPEPVLMGTMLGEEVARTLERTNAPMTISAIKTEFKTIDLPGKEPGELPSAVSSRAPFKITVAGLGDIAFVGLGGEVFTEIGRTIKAASPFKQTIIVTHCNGAAGYVPTR